tara:strand:- start:84 stop:824 length:741 start_codon:yes stop_codon:yes gene_type:complete
MFKRRKFAAAFVVIVMLSIFFKDIIVTFVKNAPGDIIAIFNQEAGAGASRFVDENCILDAPEDHRVAGLIWTSDKNGVVFQNEVLNLLSAKGDPDSWAESRSLGLADISSLCGADTGARFVLELEIDTNEITGIDFIASGELLLIFFDSLSVYNSDVPGIGIFSDHVIGNYNKGIMIAKASWSGGVISFLGKKADINGDLYVTGQVYYDNNVNFSNDKLPPQPDTKNSMGYIGEFSVPECKVLMQC